MAHLTISPHALSADLHLPDIPQILDMRDEEDAAADPRRIPGARALSLAELEVSDLSSGNFVCACQKGGKLSQLGAAILRDRGAAAASMEGGHLVWVAADLPLIGARPLAARWVMPTDPTWDELTSLWVLRRLVDRTVPVMPVTRDWLTKAAEIWGARPVLGKAEAIAALAGLTHPVLKKLGGGSDRLVSGRLTRATTPLDALDLVDDWLAGAVA